MMAFVPSIARTVHYVAYGTPGGEYASVCRAAFITEVSDELAENADQPCVSLAVMNPTGMFFNTHICHSADNKPGTWHEPERVG